MGKGERVGPSCGAHGARGVLGKVFSWSIYAERDARLQAELDKANCSNTAVTGAVFLVRGALDRMVEDHVSGERKVGSFWRWLLNLK